MPNQYLSNEDRKRIINAYIDGNSANNISRIMGFKRTSVYSIIKKYADGESVERKLKGGLRRKSLTTMHINQIKEWIDEDCSISLKKIKEKCEVELNVKVSKSTIANYIESFSYTLKRVHRIPERRNSESTIEKRALYADEFMRVISLIDDSKIFFIDEVGFNVSMRSKRGRSYIGKPAIQVVPTIRSRNISVCCSISKNGILEFKAQARAFNTNYFLEFINLLIQKLIDCSINSAVFIMDNVAFHKTHVIIEAINNAGHRVIFLPPYSPFLNPLENMFSKWKQLIQNVRVTNENDLFNAIEDVSQMISMLDCNGYYRHMLSFIPRCLKKEEIVEE